MPFIKQKRRVAIDLHAVIGPCAGSASDFVALAYCPELDVAESDVNPDHRAFTHVFRYQNGKRTILGRYPARLEGLSQVDAAQWIAVGDLAGYVQISAEGLIEVTKPQPPGINTAIWSAGGSQVFTVGSFPAFASYYRNGVWEDLSLPPGASTLLDVCGFTGNDVYMVGGQGQVHHFDGTRVERVRVPVKSNLTCVVRLDERRMCVGGYSGTLLVGASAHWRRLNSETRAPLLSIAALNGNVYFSAEGRLWSTDGVSPIVPICSFSGNWMAGLSDALVLVDAAKSWLFQQTGQFELDTALTLDGA